MTQIHLCSDQSDAVNLSPVLGLFLKPIARINVTVHFPTLKQSLPTGGKSVSSWEVMEKIKGLVSPDNFISLKVVKNTLEFIRFEGDLENRNILKTIITRLDGRSLKLTGFKELLKIRAAETKVPFPSKYDWDSFFRDAKHMNEMKAGERPDTIHFQCLPCKWFSEKKTMDKPVPSEKLFRRVWETFGEVRCVDIPVLDLYRQQMQPNIAGIKTFTFSQDPVFEAYVQYKDYLSFVRAMDALRGCFLMYQEGNKSWVASIKVGFDKSKHLSDESIRKRKAERERLMEDDKTRERAKLKTKGSISLKEVSTSANGKPSGAELTKDETKTVEYKIALEERMYMVARRKLESVRLLDYIFDRIKKRYRGTKRGNSLEGTSQRSSPSKSDRLSPSFYNVERSPRIDKCRTPQSSKINTRTSSSPRRSRSDSRCRSTSRGHSRGRGSPSTHRNSSRDQTSRRYRSISRGRSASKDRSLSRRRGRSGSRRRSTDKSSCGHPRRRSRTSRGRDERSRSVEFRRSRSRSREISPRSRGSRIMASDRSSYGEKHSFYNNRGRRPPRSFGDGQISRDIHSNHYSYVHDTELKPHRSYYYPSDRGRGGFRGRGYRHSGRADYYSVADSSYVDYEADPVYLQEAYNHAYTKYFNSISKTSYSQRPPNEDEGNASHSRSRSRSPHGSGG